MRRRGGQRQGRETELCGRLPDKDRHRMFVLCPRHAHVNCDSSGRLELSLRLLAFHFRSDSSLESTLVEFQGLLVLLYRRVQELFFGVQAAGLKIINCQIRVHTQVDCGQVCRTGLRLLPVGLNIFANAPPYVSLIRHAERQDKVVVGDAIENRGRGRPAARGPLPSCRWRGRHGGKVVSPVVAQRRPRLPKLSLCRLQILIRYVDLRLQRIELRILEYRPPRTTKVLVIGLSGSPVPYLFIAGRRLNYGRMVFGADGASGQLEYRDAYQKRSSRFPRARGNQFWSLLHLASPGNVALTIWTSCPETI